jgi:gamma-glutamyl hercynylcysteine S-oxide synthase
VRNASKAVLTQGLTSARDYTLRLIDTLSPEQWTVPCWPEINPPLWELGHVGWFQEYWCLRQRNGKASRPSMLGEADQLFDSSRIAHDLRWQLALPGVHEIREYLSDVLDQTLDRLDSLPETDEALYFHRLALFHEQMHIEAFAWTWQALGYAEVPSIAGETRESRADTAFAQESGPIHLPPFRRLAPDHQFEGGVVSLGSQAGDSFVFDNEKWAHEVKVAPFEIALQPVINAEYLQFVNDRGYEQAEFWDPGYFKVLQASGRRLPVYWKENKGRILMRRFDQWLPVETYDPVMHVSAFEAEAFCRWAGKRLPTEAEWEFALTHSKAFDWGDRVWEWTASAFEPFPGFSPDPYKEYSAPWFGDHRVVKGGSFITPRGLVDSKFRNFFQPHRADIFVGFRVCSV